MTVVPSTRETTDALVALADAVEKLSSEWGIRLPLPVELISAAERIVLAARTPRTENMARNASVGQLIVWYSGQDEDVTAPLLCKRISEVKDAVTTKSVSVALHRAAERGQFERRERGVYRLTFATPCRFSPEQPAGAPVSEEVSDTRPTPDPKGDGGHGAAEVAQEAAMS